MNELQSTIERGLQAQQVLDQPKPPVTTTVFSVYVPVDLMVAFKQVCRHQGESHPTVMRRLIAEYIDNVREEDQTATQ